MAFHKCLILLLEPQLKNILRQNNITTYMFCFSIHVVYEFGNLFILTDKDTCEQAMVFSPTIITYTVI